MSGLLFVYGTLQRGRVNHGQLAGQRFVGPAWTVPGFRLHDLGGYPGLVPYPAAETGVSGEVWAVDATALARLDAFEGVGEGLYRRGPVALQAPYAGEEVEAYFPVADVTGRPVVGDTWRVP